MAAVHNSRSRAIRTLIGFGVLVATIFGLLGFGVATDRTDPTPKLGLDLVGGTQIILTPRTTDGSNVDEDAIEQAISIIRQRVDSSGVAEAEIASLGGSNIVVSLPGVPSQETLDLVRQSAQMRFRPVLATALPFPTQDESPITPELPVIPETQTPTNPSDPAWITQELQDEFFALDCTNPDNLIGGGGDVPDEPLVACQQDGTAKYILGITEIEGYRLNSAAANAEATQAGTLTGRWVVNLEFDDEGTRQFREVTTRITGLSSPYNQFAMVLDGLVVSAPVSQAVITDGQAQITGNFDRASARVLSNQLKFGALPLDFDVQSERELSATLGAEQLEKGLLAGGIGLLLVVLYCLLQYRALAGVTLATMIAAGIFTYGTISVLSWIQGYTLSLAGVAALIISIGIVADSFILYFERVRDELRDGHTLEVAVERGWDRAKRTIVASDMVNLLIAIVLYYVAVGGVQGFAFTLGLVTVIDLIVSFWFLHPLVKLIARTRFFGEGHPWSGLSPERLGVEGARYMGRGRVSLPAESKADKEARAAKAAKAERSKAAGKEGPSGLTLAERRALEKKQAELSSVAAASDADAESSDAPSAEEQS